MEGFDVRRLAADLTRRPQATKIKALRRQARHLARADATLESWAVAAEAHDLAILCEKVGLTEEARALWKAARQLLEASGGDGLRPGISTSS